LCGDDQIASRNEPVSLTPHAKITVPSCGVHTLRRTVINQVLDGGARVTSVVGAAGFGKSTAVASWANSSVDPVAWYTIDAVDDQPAVFWRNLTEAIGRVLPLEWETSDDVTGQLRSIADVEGLLAVLGDDPREVVVVIDDLHLVAGTTVVDDLALLIERAPAQMRFVLIARVLPGLPLGRWAVRELLAEVSERHLSMDRSEAAAVVRSSAPEGVPESVVEGAVDAAHGWPAALRLAGRALEGTNAERITASTLSTDRLFVAFVVEEILDDLPAHLRRIIVQLSLLRDLDPRRCEKFCDVNDGRMLLDELVGAGIPILILDPVSYRHRMHPLMQFVLAAELRQTRADEIAALHVFAAEVELSVGTRTNAVHHLIDAGEFEGAFKIAFSSVREMYHSGLIGRMDEWIDRFPPEFVAASPDRCSAFALALAYLGRREEAERWTRIGTDRLEGTSLRDDMVLTQARVMAALDCGDTDTVRNEVTAFRLRHDADEIDRDRDSQLHTAMAVASLVDERLDEAAYWVRSLARWPDLSERLRKLGHPTRAAWEAYLRGSLHESAQIAEGLLGEVGAFPRVATPVLIELYALLATLSLERLDLDQADYWSSSASDRLDGIPSCLHRFIVDRVSISVAEARSGTEAAIRELRMARAVALPTLAERYELWLADLEARGGLRKSAARRLASLPSSPRKSLVLARLAVLADRPEIVRGNVSKLVDLPVAMKIEAALLSARVAPGSREAERAAALGAEAGYVWTYRREGPEMDQILRDVMAADARLSGTPLAVSLSFNLAEGSYIAVALTDAEHRVLAFLPSYRSLSEIAAEMSVSVNTVKTHVRSIYAKLGVGTRKEAVKRADAMGLLVRST